MFANVFASTDLGENLTQPDILLSRLGKTSSAIVIGSKSTQRQMFESTEKISTTKPGNLWRQIGNCLIFLCPYNLMLIIPTGKSLLPWWSC